MKPAQLGTLNSDLAPIEEDLATRIEAIRPLSAAVRIHRAGLLRAAGGAARHIALERELVVSDIGVYPYLNADQCEQIYNEIAVALLDFMFERPAARTCCAGGLSSARCTDST